MRSLIVMAGGVCLLATAAAAVSPAVAQVPGGWSQVSVRDKGVVDAAQFAVRARQRAMDAAGEGGKIGLSEIVHAEQQVVQGMNYRLTLRVRAGDTMKTAEATIWARVWLEGDERYKLTAWRFPKEKESEPRTAREPAAEAAAGAGSWSVVVGRGRGWTARRQGRP